MATKTKKTTTPAAATKAAKKPRTNRWKVSPELQAAAEAAEPTAETPTKPAKSTKTKPAPAEKKERGLSAIDAAVTVLGEADAPMSSKELIAAMSAKGYWTSPGGKTPHATLYSAILREISQKGPESRFQKTERGRFALAGTTPPATPKASQAAPPRKKKGAASPPEDGSPGPNSVAELFRI
jgi:hypothetical protein